MEISKACIPQKEKACFRLKSNFTEKTNWQYECLLKLLFLFCKQGCQNTELQHQNDVLRIQASSGRGKEAEPNIYENADYDITQNYTSIKHKRNGVISICEYILYERSKLSKNLHLQSISFVS